MQFNEDGSLKLLKEKKKRDHLPVLKAIDELPFGMGKKLLISHLQGKQNSRSAKLKLDQYFSFGQLGGFQEEEIAKLMTFCQKKGLITTKIEGRFTTLVLTTQGKEELDIPQMEVDCNNLSHEHSIYNPFTAPNIITEEDIKLFDSLHHFFPHFSDEQKKAVTCNSKRILCVAGAGSGKTSVLTKRIEFLVNYRGVSPKDILAITFTKKARQEMQNRIQLPVRIETFNSFCEKILQNHDDELMIPPKEKIRLLIESLQEHGHTPKSITQLYFTQAQRRGKEEKSLFFSFFYDFQTLVDRSKFLNSTPEKLVIPKDHEHTETAFLLQKIAANYLLKMRVHRYRDYADQLIKVIELFKQNPSTIPSFSHILVDEYQDVNDIQIELLHLLNPSNLFVVGDPRQSIYGWRGSRIQHILEFTNAEIIQLSNNYRSTQAIIETCNQVMRNSGYQPLQAHKKNRGTVKFIHHKTEDEQATTIARHIISYSGKRSDIFVLSRTNKGLQRIKEACDYLSISYLMRTEELKQSHLNPQTHQITLATVHAIKGLEAKRVYIIGANNFPCKASDHPVMELFNLNQEYDSYAEELRVLYVALSRAEEDLFVHYTGSLSPFFPKIVAHEAKVSSTDSVAAMMRLRQWRYKLAKDKGCPAYVICSDRTLEFLLTQRPSTLDELYEIPGLGQRRVEEFGTELLSVLVSL